MRINPIITYKEVSLIEAGFDASTSLNSETNSSLLKFPFINCTKLLVKVGGKTKGIETIKKVINNPTTLSKERDAKIPENFCFNDSLFTKKIIIEITNADNIQKAISESIDNTKNDWSGEKP